MNKALFVLTVIFSSLSVSCGLLNNDKSIMEPLNRYTGQIKIVKDVFSGDFQKDKKGYICISSNEDASVEYLIQNPQGLEIAKIGIKTSEDAGLNYLDDSVLEEDDNPSAPENYVVVDGKTVDSLLNNPGEILSESDYYEVSKILNHTVVINLKKNFLYQLEKFKPGIDFNSMLGLYAEDYEFESINKLFYEGEAETVPGNFYVNVEPYVSKIRINSPPPPVQGACIMEDTSSNPHCYVLCFNLPDSLFINGGIHRDMQTGTDGEGHSYSRGKIKIEGLKTTNSVLSSGESWEEGIGLDITPDEPGKDGSKGSISSRLCAYKPGQDVLRKLYELNEVEGNGLPAVVFSRWNHPVWILDDGHYTQNNTINQPYKIILEDENGLTSTVEFNANNYQLEKITAHAGIKDYDEGDVSILYSDDEENENANENAGEFILKPPVKIAGTETIFVYDVNIYYEVYSQKIPDDENEQISLFTDTASYYSAQESGEVKLTIKKERVYKINAYARKPGCIDSSVSTWYVRAIKNSASSGNP